MKKLILAMFCFCIYLLTTPYSFANEEEPTCVNKTTNIYYCFIIKGAFIVDYN